MASFCLQVCRLPCKGPNLGISKPGRVCVPQLQWSASLPGSGHLKGEVYDFGHLAARAGGLRPEDGQQEGKPLLGRQAARSL